MSVNFEELANVGLPPQREPEAPKKNNKWPLLLLLLIIVGGISYWGYRGGTQSPVSGSPDITPAAELLLVSEGETPESGVLPHTIDSATEFPSSLATLAEGSAKPEVRETEEGRKSLGLVVSEAQSGGIRLSSSGTKTEVDSKPEELVIEAAVKVDSSGKNPRQVGDSNASATQLSHFSDTTQQMQRDWGGLILIPNNVQLSRAFSSKVHLERIEAHPLRDGRLRVWIRVANQNDHALTVKVSCNFSGVDNQMSTASQAALTLPANSSIDTNFMSSFDGVRAYTILAKRIR